MSVKVVTGDGDSLPSPTATDIVSLADLKAHCRIDGVDDDALVTAYLGVAIAMVESKTQRSLLPKTYEWTTASLVNGMRIPLAPVVQVRSIKYLTFPYGPQTTLATSDYIVAPNGQGYAICKPYYLRWPWIGQGPNPVLVCFDAGDASLISDGARHAIKMIVADLFEYRTPNVLSSGSFQAPKLSDGVLSTVDALLLPDQWQ